VLKELRALKLDSVVDLGSSHTTAGGSGTAISTQSASSAVETADGAPFATPAFVKENFKSKIMTKSIDDLLHDQHSVDQLIGGAANEFIEVDQSTLQKESEKLAEHAAESLNEQRTDKTSSFVAPGLKATEEPKESPN